VLARAIARMTVAFADPSGNCMFSGENTNLSREALCTETTVALRCLRARAPWSLRSTDTARLQALAAALSYDWRTAVSARLPWLATVLLAHPASVVYRAVIAHGRVMTPGLPALRAPALCDTC